MRFAYCSTFIYFFIFRVGQWSVNLTHNPLETETLYLHGVRHRVSCAQAGQANIAPLWNGNPGCVPAGGGVDQPCLQHRF